MVRVSGVPYEVAEDEIIVNSTIKKRSEALKKARAIRKENQGNYKRQDKMEKWQKNKTSLRASIDAKCYDCSNYQKEEVRHCTVTSCPLWYVRPWQDD